MKPRHLHRWILLADLCWASAALLCAEVLRYGITWNSTDRISAHRLLPFLAATWILWAVFSSWMKLDCFSGGWHFPAVISHLFLAVCGLMGLLLGAGYLAQRFVSRLALGYFGFLLFLGFLGIRYAARSMVRARYLAGDVRRVAIVGTGRVARELAIKIERHPEMLCKVVGFLFPADDGMHLNVTPASAKASTTVPTLGVVDLLRAQQIDELILALAKPAWPEILNLTGQCREHGINVSFVPEPYELYLSKLDLLDVDGLPLLQLQDPARSYALWGHWKRGLDIVLGSLLLVIALPMLLPAVMRLRRIKGRGLREETRCGKNGQPFSMLRLNVDRPANHASRFERILEKLSLTELPQLWNVVRGEMALVGPRPESPQRVQCYSEWQRQRLIVKPGITGLAQVHGLREQHSSEEKARFDLQYLLNPSPLIDVSLLLQTLWTLAIRFMRYSRLSPAATTPTTELAFSESTSPFLQETLQGVHRSQSSAD
ncbi:MAG TPA: sugar transferase [Terriglobales bacterium]|nr:sugar transferase [Terriglobales bacterium]